MDRRARRKAETRQAMQEAAFELFLAQGYENTTVAQIAEASGVSHMTFFRHFPTKEDVVLSDDYDPMLEELIRARPESEPPMERIRAAVGIGFEQVYPGNREALFLRSRLLLTTPALRARISENLAASQKAFERGLCRSDSAHDPPLRVRVVAAACSAALATAITAWVEENGASELPELVERAFDALRTGSGGEPAP
ncbi:AcrR family transcriptional regulator [Spinactinospora alkalitolerans]|uniref:AcrR family transcriptional regulator n=1 Tax=Spinactinospora alkalitolerans TaxID=687207 RepID=A0A852U120_9ACTN|nr:TetR/AcrR family transcriptional regulator [Spinactinospora alkalitolerans]NYE50546.1 AcrR family transcriptional regulator [Spinactinospora alkalitolerans]